MNKPNLVKDVAETIRRYGMLKEGEKVLVGLSGGPDSVCLLHLLAQLRQRYGISLCAVYIDHNLRPDETPSEVRFCDELCSRLGVEFSKTSIDVLSFAKEHRMNKQEAARELRYKVLQDKALALGAAKIALAHHADDQAETFFLRIIRGSGPAGLSGIPPKRSNIIRPLIETEKEDIKKYLLSNNISFMTDSSNLKADYARNRLRLDIMPALREMNQGLVSSLSKTMDVMREEERYFDVTVTKAMMKLISRKASDRIELFLSPMESMDVVILRRLLRRAIGETEGLRGIGFVHIEDMIRLVREGISGDRIYLPHGMRVIKDYSLLVITSEKIEPIADYDLPVPGEVAIIGSGFVLKSTVADSGPGQPGRKDEVILDADLVETSLKVRSRRPGDFFYPLGFGKRKKLQDYFVDEKVPRDERDKVPIVLKGEDIIWIAGYRADDRYRVTGATKKFLRLAIVKGRF